MNQVIDYHAILPELILSGTIVLVLFVDAFLKERSWFAMPLALTGVVASLIATLTLVGEHRSTFDDSFVGCLMMPSSRDLLVLFISLELVSAPGFLMAAFRKTDLRSNEAGLKFFLIGVLSTAVMLYGMSLMYGVTGATNL